MRSSRSPSSLGRASLFWVPRLSPCPCASGPGTALSARATALASPGFARLSSPHPPSQPFEPSKKLAPISTTSGDLQAGSLAAIFAMKSNCEMQVLQQSKHKYRSLRRTHPRGADSSPTQPVPGPRTGAKKKKHKTRCRRGHVHRSQSIKPLTPPSLASSFSLPQLDRHGHRHRRRHQHHRPCSRIAHPFLPAFAGPSRS